eukprot:13814514-Alexandrium_andersonii.AAC.1
MCAFVLAPCKDDPVRLHPSEGKLLQRGLQDEVHVWSPRAHGARSKTDDAWAIASNGDPAAEAIREEAKQAGHRRPARPGLGLRRETKAWYGDRHPAEFSSLPVGSGRRPNDCGPAGDR